MNSAHFFKVRAWHQYFQQGTQKNCVPSESIIHPTRKLDASELALFIYISTLIYLQKVGISKHSWNKMMQCNCFRQVLHVYKQNVEHRIKDDVDNGKCVCIHETFLNFTVVSMNAIAI